MYKPSARERIFQGMCFAGLAVFGFFTPKGMDWEIVALGIAGMAVVMWKAGDA